MTRRALFVLMLGCALAPGFPQSTPALSYQAGKQQRLNASRVFTTTDAERIMGYRLHMIHATGPVARSQRGEQSITSFGPLNKPVANPITEPRDGFPNGTIVGVTLRFVDPASYSSQRKTYLGMPGIRDLPNVGDEGWASLDDSPGMTASARVGDVAMNIHLFFEYSPRINRSAVASRLIEMAREVATRLR
jgi:hypothetical protein